MLIQRWWKMNSTIDNYQINNQGCTVVVVAYQEHTYKFALKFPFFFIRWTTSQGLKEFKDMYNKEHLPDVDTRSRFLKMCGLVCLSLGLVRTLRLRCHSWDPFSVNSVIDFDKELAWLNPVSDKELAWLNPVSDTELAWQTWWISFSGRSTTRRGQP